ncbi:hypothetical protein K4K57_006025 [Colletotrichum sp. SAR 10_99]|nr:hypothetical protein K4K55_007766 [Colletotrichum sp. SAR 10_96]KAJ5018223.1 hypothetical protein K4K57_006025 [Colletotrichum sp. SAR 10_99]
MTNRLNKLIRDTEDIRRKTLESALADMPLDFEEQERPWVVERIKDSFRAHFPHIHYDTLDGCPLVSYHLRRDKQPTIQKSVSYLEVIIRDESETGSISQSWVEEHNKAIGELYDTADDEDCDSKSDVDEDIDELGQDAIPSPRALGSTKSEFEKTGIAEISVVEYGGLGN